TRTELARIIDSVWPEDRVSRFAKIGVVPVGVKVLHQATRFVAEDAEELISALEQRLLRTMAAAEGIGLAANQVGASVRMLAHNLPDAAPPVLLNPILLHSWDKWEYEEGCLSLQVKGVRATVRRPKVIMLIAELPNSIHIALVADELLS